MASPFASPPSSPVHLSLENGSPSSPTIFLSPELDSAPLLRKRESINSVKSFMKNASSPFSSPSPSPFPSPSPDRHGLSPNHPNHSNTEIDPNASPSSRRERVKSFVKSIRRTSSQLFKKDKKDGDSTPKKSTSTITSLVSETLGVSTAPTTPNILRRFSHSKRPSMNSVTTLESGSDLSTSYLEVKVGEGGCIHSPVVEVASPVSPVVVQPLDPAPMSPLKEICNEEDACPETVSEHPDPLQFPLPPSPTPPPAPLPTIDPVDPLQPAVDPREDDAWSRDDEHVSSDDSAVSSSTPSLQPPATPDIVLTAPPPDRTAQPSPELLPPSPTMSGPPGPDSDDDGMEMRDLYIPALIAPARFLPIPSLRLSYFFKPVLTWWLSKDVLSYPYLYS